MKNNEKRTKKKIEYNRKRGTNYIFYNFHGSIESLNLAPKITIIIFSSSVRYMHLLNYLQSCLLVYLRYDDVLAYELIHHL